jgi:hypothetical protein
MRAPRGDTSSFWLMRCSGMSNANIRKIRCSWSCSSMLVVTDAEGEDGMIADWMQVVDNTNRKVQVHCLFMSRTSHDDTSSTEGTINQRDSCSQVCVKLAALSLPSAYSSMSRSLGSCSVCTRVSSTILGIIPPPERSRTHPWLDVLPKVDSVVDMQQHRLDALFVVDVHRDERHHAIVVDLSHSSRQAQATDSVARVQEE